MKTIFIDADACPVKEEIFRVATRYELKVFCVSNAQVPVPRSPLFQAVVVRSGLDVADDWIADRAGKGDIVITEDIPLAARCIENEAAVIGTRGDSFDETSIGSALASRELFSQLRDQGAISGGPRPFQDKDRSKFLQQLDKKIQRFMKREWKDVS